MKAVRADPHLDDHVVEVRTVAGPLLVPRNDRVITPVLRSASLRRGASVLTAP